MYKGVFWPPVFLKEKLYPQSQVDMERKQNAFSLEGPNPTHSLKPKRGLPPHRLWCHLDYTNFIALCMHGSVAMLTEGKRLTRNGLFKPKECFLTNFYTFPY